MKESFQIKFASIQLSYKNLGDILAIYVDC